MSGELVQARARLEAAIVEVDRLVCERDGDPRTDREMLTHWAVVYSFHRAEDDGESTQLAEIRSAGLSYWQVAGLYNCAARVAEDEPYTED